MSEQHALALALPAASNIVVINARCSLRIEADQRVIVVGGLPVHHYRAEDAVAEAYAMVFLVELLAAVKNHTFFGDGQAKGGLGEMPSAAVGTQSRACIPVNRGSAGNAPWDAPSGWTATGRTRSADLAVLSTVTSRTKR